MTPKQKRTVHTLLSTHGLLDEEGIDGWQVVVRNLVKLGVVWEGKSAPVGRAGLRNLLRKGGPEKELFVAAGICVFRHKVIFIDRAVHPDDFEQTLLHEIAHALVGKGGHGPEWRKVARRIGYRFGKVRMGGL